MWPYWWNRIRRLPQQTEAQAAAQQQSATVMDLRWTRSWSSAFRRGRQATQGPELRFSTRFSALDGSALLGSAARVRDRNVKDMLLRADLPRGGRNGRTAIPCLRWARLRTSRFDVLTRQNAAQMEQATQH